MTTPRSRRPTHPGEILREDVIPALKLTPQEAAAQLNVPPDELARVLDGDAPVTAELAARIETWLGVDHGGDAQHWLAMQAQYDLWRAHQRGVAAEVTPALGSRPTTRFRRHSPEREAEIQRGIAQDPDVPELTTDQIRSMKARRFDTPSPEETAEIERHAIEDDNPIATAEDVARAVSCSDVFGEPLPERLADQRYTYLVRWSGEDAEFVGLCPSFPSLSWLAKTPEEALTGMRRVVVEVVQDLLKDNEPLP
ncbi:addiction module HigA family antidote [Paraburkholderia tropica]|uniref:HigA family addiction module antitoxin n=1 Tax=Paraburkholderia tropica TaxID=92647 RepID=UPI00161FA501|nr:HigA family addiction module antitoxin [Paraburkholderia tropica]MBB3005333.1 addiction module HigA family antidote [Paraburkholderia tropica]